MVTTKAFLHTIVGGAILALTTISTTALDAQTIEQKSQFLSVWLEAQRDYHQYPSLSVAYVRGQDTPYLRAFGYSDVESEIRATEDTRYSICSISKLFTAVGVMSLVEDQKLNLTTPIEQIIDWYEIEAKGEATHGPVTLANLLSHSSGMMREVDTPYWDGPDFAFPTRDEVIQLSRKHAPLYQPYDRFQYSNLGLTLAGEAIRAASGEPYEAFIEATILSPLGMQATTPYMPTEMHGAALAIGYSAKQRSGDRQRLPVFDAKGINAAAGFASTPSDLARFAKWQLRLLASEGGDDILTPVSLRQMQRPHFVVADWSFAWGLGFEVYRSGGQTYVGHGGSCPGYRSKLLLSPEEQTAAIVMVNSNWVNATGLAQTILKIMSESGEQESEGANFTAEDYTGVYSGQPWGPDFAVIEWGASLVTIDLDASDPLEGMIRLQHADGDQFQVIDRFGRPSDPINFIRDKSGDVQSLKRHSTFSHKLGPLPD